MEIKRNILGKREREKQKEKKMFYWNIKEKVETKYG